MQAEATTLKLALGIEYDGSRYYGWQRQMKYAACRRSWRKRWRK